MRGLRAASELSKEFSIGTCIYEVNEDPENFLIQLFLKCSINLTLLINSKITYSK